MKLRSPIDYGAFLRALEQCQGDVTMEELSPKLLYFSDMMRMTHGVYTWVLSPELDLLYSSCPDQEAFFAFLSTDSGFSDLAAYACAEEENPVLLESTIGLNWIVTKRQEDQLPLQVFMIGPVFTADTSQAALEQAMHKRSYPKAFLDPFLTLLRQIPILAAESWLRLGTMLHYTVTDVIVSILDFRYLGTQSIPSHPDDGLPAPGNAVYLAEQKMLHVIESGQVDYPKEVLSAISRLGSSVLPRSVQTSLRWGKNYSITNIGLQTRAAIRGGLAPGIAFHLGEVYIRKVESTNNIMELSQINHIAFDDFVHRVHAARGANAPSSAIQACCGYIEIHLGEKITVSELARLAGYSDTYLAQKFIAETGKTISQYVKDLRIQQAKLRLKGTADPIAQIADSLGFCNPSYFIRTFREATGLSPKEYRG